MKKFLIVFLALFFYCETYATHLAGAEIFYKSLGGNQYLVTLHVFRDCSGASQDLALLRFSSTCGQFFIEAPAQAAAPVNVSQLCPQQMNNSACNGGVLPGMEKYTYTVVVNLPTCSSWEISWSDGYRNTSVNAPNSNWSDFYVSAFLNNQEAPTNSSAFFTSPPQPYYCVNQQACLNLGPVETDGHTLSFALVAAMTDMTTQLNYAVGYTPAQPITGITINAATGELNFTPTLIGNFIVTVECTEKNAAGVIIGKVRRDFQVVVSNCSNQSVSCNQGNIVNVSSGTVPGSAANTLQICENVPFCFDILFTDPNTGDSIKISSPNLATSLPGSTMVMSYTPGITNAVRGTICWTPPPGSANSNTFFNLLVKDNACPVPAFQTLTYFIDVLAAANAGSDINLCAGQTATLQGSGPGTVFSWTDLAGNSIPVGPAFSCNPCQNPVVSPANTSTYVLTTNGGANCRNSDTVVVSMSFPVTPTITAVADMCSNAASFSLSAAPAGGTWSVTAAVSAAGLFTPSMAVAGNNTVTYVHTSPGCLPQAVQQIVKVEAYVPSTITGTLNPLCITHPTVNLMSLPQHTTGVWSGPGVSGSGFDPVLAGVGNHVLTYSTTSAPTASLCPSSSTLAVNVSSIQQPTATPAGPYCDSYSAQTMSVTPGGGIWSGTGVDASGIFTPAQAATGANKLVYTLTNGPCTATSSVTVAVEKFLAASLTVVAKSFCIYDAATNLQLLAANPGGTWKGNGVNGSLFTPATAGIGTYTLSYHTASAPTASLCPDSSYLQIVVNPKPEVNALSDKLQGCEPLMVGFYTTSANTGAGRWDFGNNTTGNGLAAATTYTNPGTYQAAFYYTDPNGCLDTTRVASMITVWDTPDARIKANPNVTTIVASEISFTNSTSNLNNNTYQWTFMGTAGSTEVNPIYTFPETGTFPVQMIATSPEGCKDTAVVVVTVNPDVVMYVANAFTPGNGDGLNDILYVNLPPTGIDYSSFHWQIFDRWGSLLFQSNDIYKGWNGAKNNSGELVPQGVYVWRISFRDSARKYYEKAGHVTLLK